MSRRSNDKPRIAAVMGEIGLAAADQVVDHPHAIAALQQQIDHVAADEAGAAGDDCDTLAHYATRQLIRRLGGSSCGGHCNRCRPPSNWEACRP